MSKIKNKKLWKNIGIGCLTGALCLGAVAGLSALAKNAEEDTKVIKPKYEIGALTGTGRYLETEESIYTKDAFECDGLDIELDFRSNVSYMVYFYDTENEFLSATSKLTANYDETQTPEKADFARIVITPKDDNKISWYEINGYANQLTISVNKEQTPYVAKNFYELDSTTIGKEFKITNGVGEYVDNPTFYHSKWFDVKAGETYLIGLEDTFVASNQVGMFNLKKSDGTYTTSVRFDFNCTNSGEMLWEEFTIPADCVSVSFFANNASGTYQEFTINLK